MMNINEANLKNLTGLWKKYGALPFATNQNITVNCHSLWPLRCWPEGEKNTDDDLSFFLDHIPDTAMVPVFLMNLSEMQAPLSGYSLFAESSQQQIQKRLQARGWQCVLKQTAMYLPLPGSISRQASALEPPLASQCLKSLNVKSLSVKSIETPEDIRQWVTVCSEGFGYSMDLSVIEKIAADQNIRLFSGIYENQVAATALIFKTGDFVGVHQLSVNQAFRGKGIARHFMEYLLWFAESQWQASAVVLQSSEAGLALYERLGFIKQFVIQSYQRGR